MLLDYDFLHKTQPLYAADDRADEQVLGDDDSLLSSGDETDSTGVAEDKSPTATEHSLPEVLIAGKKEFVPVSVQSAVVVSIK